MPVSDTRFITAALPYANGPLHFGHLAGVYVPADIYYRHSVLTGKRAVYICGSDEHGVAITLSAEKNKTTYQAWVDKWYQAHQILFNSYDIHFSFFGRTTSPKHKQLAQEFFLDAHKNGYLNEKAETQAYCLNDKMFLPDRYLSGTCKRCGYPEARGDECPNCGAWLKLDEIQNPKCAKCGQSNIESREVKQWYFNLPKLEPQIRAWLQGQTEWKENVKNYALSLLKDMPERAITRNVPWGIDLPGKFHEEGKKIYVWFEAPVGYLTNLVEYAEKMGGPASWKEFWDEPSSMIHFIGKDNIIFHTIIWPAMLMAAGKRLPTNVPANMFVQLMKKQFSKSSGWYVDAEEAIATYGVDRVRYYLISLIPEFQDTNFDWQIFHDKVNSELVNKIANLFNRVGTQIQKHYGGIIENNYFSDIAMPPPHNEVLSCIEGFRFNDGLSKIVQLAEAANKFLDEEKPWNVIKEDREKAKHIFARASVHMLSIAGLLQPFLPSYADRVLKSFSIEADPAVRGRLYTEGALCGLQKAGLRISSDANFVVPRIDQAVVKEEIGKLGKLGS